MIKSVRLRCSCCNNMMFMDYYVFKAICGLYCPYCKGKYDMSKYETGWVSTGGVLVRSGMEKWIGD